jgi:hypothetical protein
MMNNDRRRVGASHHYKTPPLDGAVVDTVLELRTHLQHIAEINNTLSGSCTPIRAHALRAARTVALRRAADARQALEELLRG